MIETWQILLVAVVTVITILLTIIGIQIVYILKEARYMLVKINTVVSDAAKITKTVSTSVGSVAGFGAGLKAALSIVSVLKKNGKRKSE